MDTKLTLKLNKSVIASAKGYAKRKKTSISKLVESYLNILTDNGENISEITPFVKSLSGTFTIPKGYDEQKEYKSHLSKKYGK